MEHYRYIRLESDRSEITHKLNDYLYYLIIIGLFYITPSTQFIFFQANNNITCYYNFKCKHEYGIIPSLNNFISNAMYIVLGIVYLITVKLKSINSDIKDMVLFNKSLYYCLGFCLIFEGIASSLYHICPSKLNLQFDTTFMFIGIVMSYLALYNNRHIGLICDAFKFYFILFLVMILNIVSLVKKTNSTHWWIWLFTFMIVVYCLFFTSVYIFVGKNYDLDLKSVYSALRILTIRSEYMNPQFWFIVVTNVSTLSMLLYASLTNAYFTGWLLLIGIVNLSIYFSYYIVYKKFNKEKISKNILIFTLLDMVLFILALYFYYSTNYNTFIEMEESNKLNSECILFNFFDNHDIWHFLSAIALYIFMNIILFIDQDIDFNLIYNFNSEIENF